MYGDLVLALLSSDAKQICQTHSRDGGKVMKVVQDLCQPFSPEFGSAKVRIGKTIVRVQSVTSNRRRFPLAKEAEVLTDRAKKEL